MTLKGIILLASGGLLGFISGFNFEFLIIWGIFVLIDIITGIICSHRNNIFSKRKLFEGFLKKIIECVIIIGFIFIQYIVTFSGIIIPISGAVIFAFCYKEFGSTLENVDKTFPNMIPQYLIKWFLITEGGISSLFEKKESK